jgi:hypothetical protein
MRAAIDRAISGANDGCHGLTATRHRCALFSPRIVCSVAQHFRCATQSIPHNKCRSRENRARLSRRSMQLLSELGIQLTMVGVIHYLHFVKI